MDIIRDEGLESQQQQCHAAACLALGSSLALDPDVLYEPCMDALRHMLDRGPHDALHPNEIKIFQTPEGAYFLPQESHFTYLTTLSI